MVPCQSMSVAILALLFGCRGLDSVAIVAGEHCAADRDVTVGCIRDGDTFEVDSCEGEAVRMLGVDAPEIAHDSTEVDDCFGPESTDWLTDLLLEEEVRLEFDADCDDGHERTLAYAWLTDDEGEETLANEAIIRAGYARFYEEFSDIRLADRLAAAEADAQAANAGLWGVCE